MKYALVTGGSRGIGREISLTLAEMGYNLILNYRGNDEKAAEAKALIEATGRSCDLLKFDVADLSAVKDVLGSWIDENSDKCIEVLVNNAGIRDDELMIFMSDDQWSSVLDTSLGGFFNVTRLLLKGMLINKYGRVVNIVSLSGIKGLPGQVNYSAAKAGVIGATKALAQEVAKKKITVNAVAPGFIKTDMTADINEKDYKAHIPLRRFGTPKEVAHVVGFLASENASYITGEVISVNGGLYT
ncbi:3-oxoacyl-ACP reductase FabG [Thermodesulfobacteriota bacterium]